jgi:hypothetical protein
MAGAPSVWDCCRPQSSGCSARCCPSPRETAPITTSNTKAAPVRRVLCAFVNRVSVILWMSANIRVFSPQLTAEQTSTASGWSPATDHGDVCTACIPSSVAGPDRPLFRRPSHPPRRIIRSPVRVIASRARSYDLQAREETDLFLKRIAKMANAQTVHDVTYDLLRSLGLTTVFGNPAGTGDGVGRAVSVQPARDINAAPVG